jgi:hypothetical protein
MGGGLSINKKQVDTFNIAKPTVINLIPSKEDG